ncbi:Unconventional myosin-Vb [Eumeta japonica]|uniref:Unconventional myosin-Vb n=1 Tax=Eumeta variegata TaxID=151549 RepID=A0A4C1T708_EUMVA|nr:Unconventional myosin-Vb [Eumeta japonica]
MGELLKVNSDELRKWLKTRQIESVNELVLIPNSLEAAIAARDALAKHMYANSFMEYDVNGFLEKNRDAVSKELVNVIRQSKMSLCKQLMDMPEIDTLSADAIKTHTLGGRLIISAAKKQPNEAKLAFKWDAPKIVQQLRACGVLETVRISAAGFPSRWVYLEFYMRYQLLCHRSLANKSDLRQSCQNIAAKWITDEDKYRFGNTQIFFRAGQVAYLEQVRANLRKKYITIIQSVVRRFIWRKRFCVCSILLLVFSVMLGDIWHVKEHKQLESKEPP